MANLLSDLLDFFFKVFGHWQAYVTGGGIMAVLNVWERLSGKTISRQTYINLVIFGFSLVAFFLAYHDEHRAFEDAQGKWKDEKAELIRQRDAAQKAPNVVVNIPPVIFNSPRVDQNAFLQLDEIKPSPNPLTPTVGTPISFSIFYASRGALPVSGAFQINMLKLVEGPVILEQEKTLFQDFKNQAETSKRGYKSKGLKGVSVGVGTKLWDTIKSRPLGNDDINNLVHGNLTIYVFGHVYWNENPNGIDVCMRLQQPSGRPKVPEQMVWHFCVL